MDASLRNRWQLGILAVALGLRVVAAIGLTQWLESRQPPRMFLIAGDAEGYWDLAGDLAAGREYAVYQPPRRVLRMPGFPAVLAVARFFCGESLLAARLLLAVVGTAACWAVGRLTADLIDAEAGLCAAALAAASPVMVAFTPVILSETTFALTMLLGLIAAGRLIRAHQQRPWLPTGDRRGEGGTLGWAALTGLALALGCYVRPSWLLAGPCVALGLLALSGRRGAALRDGVVLHLALFTALLPWGLRNQQATGEFVLTTLWMGPSLYDGLNPQATGDSEMSFFDRDNLLGQGLSEADANRHYRDAAWAFVLERPGRALQLAAIKLARYGSPWPNAEQFRHPALLAAAALAFLAALGLAGHGAWITRRDWLLLGLAVGPILYFAAIHAVFVSSLRYRLPAEYPLLALSAVGLRGLWSLLRRRQHCDGESAGPGALDGRAGDDRAAGVADDRGRTTPPDGR